MADSIGAGLLEEGGQAGRFFGSGDESVQALCWGLVGAEAVVDFGIAVETEDDQGLGIEQAGQFPPAGGRAGRGRVGGLTGWRIHGILGARCLYGPDLGPVQSWSKAPNEAGPFFCRCLYYITNRGERNG